MVHRYIHALPIKIAWWFFPWRCWITRGYPLKKNEVDVEKLWTTHHKKNRLWYIMIIIFLRKPCDYQRVILCVIVHHRFFSDPILPNFWRSPMDGKIRRTVLDLPREMVGELIGKIILISYDIKIWYIMWSYYIISISISKRNHLIWELVILRYIKYWSIYVHMIWEFVTNTHGLRLKMGTSNLSICQVEKMLVNSHIDSEVLHFLANPGDSWGYEFQDDSQTEMPSTISSKIIVRPFAEFFHEFRGWNKFILEWSCWLVLWNMNLIIPIFVGMMIQSDELFLIFQRGRAQPPTRRSNHH